MGVQIYIELVDDDNLSPEELIDRFAINVSIPIGTEMERTTYQGIFGFAAIDISFRVVCAEDFYGPNCDMPCLDNCTCEPGFTGEFCATSIDDCVGVKCGLNQRCVDGHLSFSCECQPGYTGPNCTMDINECIGINCTNGECIDGLASFVCACDHGYTGQFCETRLDGYELQVTIYSFFNPIGACADLLCDGACCEASCPNLCDYYFSFCQTSLETPVSLIRSISNVSCFTLKTFPFVYNEQRSFIDTVFGVPNPIIFTGLQWVSPWTACILEEFFYEFEYHS